MKRKRKGRMVWISRDPERVEMEAGAQYEIYLRKPRLWTFRTEKSCVFSSKNLVYVFCGEQFERITGFTLKQGECKKVRVSIEIVP